MCKFNITLAGYYIHSQLWGYSIESKLAMHKKLDHHHFWATCSTSTYLSEDQIIIVLLTFHFYQ